MKESKLTNLFSLDLQRFTEGGEAETNGESGNQLPGSDGEQGSADDNSDEENEGDDPATFTQEEVDALIADRLKREAKKTEKQKAEAARLAGMNAEEREAERLKQLETRLAEFERKDAVNAMSREVSKMLTDAKIPVYDSVVAGLVREDAEETKEATTDFIAMIGDIKKELLKEKYTGKSPKVQTTQSQAKDDWTWEKIMAVKDTTKRQALIASHPDLFKK